MPDDALTLDEALQAFYARHHFEPGKKPWFIGVYVGCMLVPLPNVETRHRYIRQHDLHHLITGYGVGRIGEGEVSAWELGTGSMRHPMLGMMNLIALSTGMFLSRRRMWAAFRRGKESRNLYAPPYRQMACEAGKTVGALKAVTLGARLSPSTRPFAKAEFAFYAMLALAIHGLLVLPAIALRLFTDSFLGMRLFPGPISPSHVKTAMASSRQT